MNVFFAEYGQFLLQSAIIAAALVVINGPIAALGRKARKADSLLLALATPERAST